MDIFLSRLGCLLVLVFLSALSLIGCGAYYLIKAAIEPPHFLEPRVIATGKKYEPRPWYPPPKVPEQLKELSHYERVEYITP